MSETDFPDDDEEDSIPFEQVEDHGDESDALPDPHGFTDDDDYDRR